MHKKGYLPTAARAPPQGAGEEWNGVGGGEGTAPPVTRRWADEETTRRVNRPATVQRMMGEP